MLVLFRLVILLDRLPMKFVLGGTNRRWQQGSNMLMLVQLDHHGVCDMAGYSLLPWTCSRRALMKGLAVTLWLYDFCSLFR